MTAADTATERSPRNTDRVRDLANELFDALRAATGDGVGITRASYGEGENKALDIVEEKARALGLRTERDAGANLVITLEGSEPGLPFLACGSHLDSVPQGGNFDGAAGVVAGLCVLAGFKEDGFRPRRTLKLYGLRGEESARFGKAYMGSSALFGRLTAADLDVKDADGKFTLGDAMRSVGVEVERVRSGQPLLDPKSVAAWVELHIEQGPVLVARQLPIGIVTGIRGNIRHRMVECIGVAGPFRRGAALATPRCDVRNGGTDLASRSSLADPLGAGPRSGHHHRRGFDRPARARHRPDSRKASV